MTVQTATIPTVTANTRARAADVNNIATALNNAISAGTSDHKMGGMYAAATTIASSDLPAATIDAAGIHTYLLSTSNADRTVTLPDAGTNVGRSLRFKKIDTGTGVVNIGKGVNPSIEGYNTVTLRFQFDAIHLYSDGNTWYIVSREKFRDTYALSSADLTIGTQDGIETVLITTGNTNRTITLPAVGTADGRILHFKKVDTGTGTVTIDTPGAETIDGNAQASILAQYDTLSIISDGSNWHKLPLPSSGGGSGEKNYISTGTSTASGWGNVGDLDIVTTSTASELPRENTTRTGSKITADSNTQSVADYVYYDFTLDDVDLNKKLKIKWDQKTTGTYTAGQLAVVITTQADRTTAVATPQTTAIPAADGTFITSFDTGSTATLSLVIRATGDMTTDGGIVISDVVVGPGTAVQGAVVSPVDMSGITYSAGFGTVSGPKYSANRMGTKLRVQGFGRCGTVAGTNASFDLPSGYTLDTSVLGNHSQRVGTFQLNKVAAGGVQVNSTTKGMAVFFDGSDTNTLWIGDMTASDEITKDTGSNLFANSAYFSFDFEVPIAEWSGSGTINVAQNDVEYAYNSSVTDAADTTSFAYGPAGGQFGNFTAARAKRVQFQTAIQPTDVITLEVTRDSGVTWVPAVSSGLISDYEAQNGVEYGVAVVTQSTTQVDVEFKTYRYASGATWGSAGTSYAAIDNDPVYRWRLRKIKGGAAVSFGLVSSSASGLAPAQTPQTSLTVTGTNWTTTRAVGVAYSDTAGIWRLRFNIRGTLSAGTNALTLTVANTTFKTTTGGQAVAVRSGSSPAAACAGYVDSGNSSLVVESASGTPTVYAASGDVELDSKPSWA
jgi:hypothetical protein